MIFMGRGNSSSVDGENRIRQTGQHKTCRERRMSFNLTITQRPMLECEIELILRLWASAAM